MFVCEKLPCIDALDRAGIPPVLPVEESIRLGEKIVVLRAQLGPHVDDMDAKTFPVSSRLQTTYREYESLVNQLATGNMRLTIVVFKQHPGLCMLPPQDQEDLVSDAWFTLRRCAQKYTPWYKDGLKEPYRFSTYAVKSMYFRMLRVLWEQRDIRLPVHRQEQFGAFLDAQARCRELGISDFTTIARTANSVWRDKTALTDEQIYRLHDEALLPGENRRGYRKMRGDYAKLLVLFESVSLDEIRFGQSSYRDENSGELTPTEFSLGDILASEEDAFGDVMTGLQHAAVMKVLEVLSDRERQVIQMRYLGDVKGTYEEVGRYFQVTDDRIRQIESKALRKLRHLRIKRQLIDFLNTDR